MFRTLNKTLKNKASMLLHTILPSKIPDFSVNEVENPLFFVYLNRDEIAFISHLADKNADEVIKVGLENGEFVFYPAREDSRYFGKAEGFATHEFIQMILLNKLIPISEKIYKDIAFLSDKIIEYKQIYISKLANIEFMIETYDETGFLSPSLGVGAAFNDGLKERLLNLAKTNILDTPQNLFSLIFPDGIYDVEGFMQHKSMLKGDMLKSYYNRSNLAKPDILETFTLPLGGQSATQDSPIKTQEGVGKALEFAFCVDGFYLQYSATKKMFANAKVVVKSANLINALPQSIFYSNAELKVAIEIERIIVQNLTQSEVFLSSLSSIFTLEDAPPLGTTAKNLALKIPAKRRIQLKLNRDNAPHTLKGVNLESLERAKIGHSLKMTYEFEGENKGLVGSSAHALGLD